MFCSQCGGEAVPRSEHSLGITMEGMGARIEPSKMSSLGTQWKGCGTHTSNVSSFSSLCFASLLATECATYLLTISIQGEKPLAACSCPPPAPSPGMGTVWGQALLPKSDSFCSQLY